MPTPAKTVAEYLKSLPDDRRKALQAVRKVLVANMDPRYEEGIQYGVIGWFVPHSIYPQGYHCDPTQPLPFASIASQKNHMAVYLFCIYTDPAESQRFVEQWKATGKKLDMGKSCVRFKKLEDLALDVLGDAVSRIPVDAFVAQYEAQFGASRKPAKKAGKTAASKPAAAKKPARKPARKPAGKPAKKPVEKAAKKAPARKRTAARTR